MVPVPARSNLFPGFQIRVFFDDSVQDLRLRGIDLEELDDGEIWKVRPPSFSVRYSSPPISLFSAPRIRFPGFIDIHVDGDDIGVLQSLSAIALSSGIRFAFTTKTIIALSFTVCPLDDPPQQSLVRLFVVQAQLVLF